MSRAAADLPDDPAELRRLASGLQHDVAVLEAAMGVRALLVEKLKRQLAMLRQARFGRSFEKFDGDVDFIFIGQDSACAAALSA